MNSRFNIVIFGAGALGTLFAGHLSQLQSKRYKNYVLHLTLFDSWAEQIQKIRKNGLTIIHTDGRRSQYQLHATSIRPDLPHADVVLILVKSYQTMDIAPQVSHILKNEGIVITLQNGLGNFENLSTCITPKKIVQGVTSQGAYIPEPGMVQHAGIGTTFLGKIQGQEKRLMEIAEIFNLAGIETALVDNTATLIWNKLAINAGINPLTALLEIQNGALLENNIYQQIMSEAVTEVAKIAQKMELDLPVDSLVEKTIDVCKKTSQNRSSMLQDILRSSQTEIDAICGAIIKHGQQLKIQTPVNKFLFDQVKAKENGTKFDPRLLGIFLNGHIS